MMKKKTLLIATALLCLFFSQTMAQTNKSTKVIAHRGAWKNTGVPENSIAALEHAVKMGCYGSEFDVHMSADSVLFVNHDHTIKGLHIEKTSSAELSAVKLSNDEPLPTLEAYLKAGKKQKKTRLVLEIKGSSISKERSLALAEKCVKMVKALKAEAITDYISFDYDICKKVKELNPRADVAYLNGDKSPAEIKEAGFNGVDYHFSVFRKNENWIGEMHAQNLTTNVWTVNDRSGMQWFIDKGVNFITTNEPEQLFELLK
ncbi:hypothetical protein DYBT9275_03232 [Dyadobacter sp. CECT 9275]|uniref:GP-PDE domain-containing protein n=1 Tax=Dyadobacter helix TaxID=2822344 RepID=A0A916N570_9BACT|nr:glycerophosphodiester phosphodiesterase family protein [Dyadobacter sp. CECT 9275]CAG5003802.1 hypothetical protein DYBT9275_03232 [Dyadobacter sp. CECT 9275]